MTENEGIFKFFSCSLPFTIIVFIREMKIALPLVAMVIGTATISIGQTTRKVLLEHFTQASCPPCAVYNPAINALLTANPDEIVSIKYQTSWPGTDPMNAANPSEVASRVTFYGVSSVPNSVIDGNYYNGHPDSVNQAKFDTRAAVPSNVNVDAKYWIIDNVDPVADSMRIKVNVKALTALAANTFVLQTVAIENEINFASAPGTNGEKKFEHVMKKMVPSATGTALPALAAGDSLTYDFKISLKRSNGTDMYYNIGQAALVAFVQNKTTKEVLQAGYDAPRPWLALALGEGAKQTRLKKLDEISYSLNAVSKSAQDQQIFVKASVANLPANWQMKMVVDGVEYSDTTTFALNSNQQKEVLVKLIGANDGNENKKLTLTVEANSKTIFPTVKSSTKFIAFTPTNNLLVDLVGGSGASRFTSVFTAQSSPYLTLIPEEAANLDAADLEYPAVRKIFYQAGDKSSGTMPEYTANMLSSYLASGGNLFVIGQDIGYDLFATGGSNTVGQDFFAEKLGAEYVGDGSMSAVTIAPVQDEEIFAPYFTGTVNLSSSNYPEQLAVNASAQNAVAILQYGANNNDAVAAIRNGGDNDSWKCVYVGFRIESLNSSPWRTALIGTATKWFDGTLTANEFDQALKSIGNVFPNPAADVLFIPVGNQSGVIRIFDLSGKTILSSPINILNGNLAKVNTSGITSGMYLIQVEQGGKKSDFQKITISK